MCRSCILQPHLVSEGNDRDIHLEEWLPSPRQRFPLRVALPMLIAALQPLRSLHGGSPRVWNMWLIEPASEHRSPACRSLARKWNCAQKLVASPTAPWSSVPGSLRRRCLALSERGGGRRHPEELTFPLSSVLQWELEHGQVFLGVLCPFWRTSKWCCHAPALPRDGVLSSASWQLVWRKWVYLVVDTSHGMKFIYSSGLRNPKDHVTPQDSQV